MKRVVRPRTDRPAIGSETIARMGGAEFTLSLSEIDPADDAAITRAVPAMADGIERRVVAEGVETAEPLSFLRGRHCDEAQGYLLSRPLPPEELEAVLRERGPPARAGTDSRSDPGPRSIVRGDRIRADRGRRSGARRGTR